MKVFSFACLTFFSAAKAVLEPLIECVAERAKYIMSRMLYVALDVLSRDSLALSSCQPLLSRLSLAYSAFLDSLSSRCVSALRSDLEALVCVVDWDELLPHTAEYQQPPLSPSANRKRVAALMNSPARPPLPSAPFDDSSHAELLSCCGRLFHSIRLKFLLIARAKLNALFLRPMYESMTGAVLDVFRLMPSEAFDAIFEAGFKGLEEQKTALTKKLTQTKALRDQFRVAQKMATRKEN